jgi:hypothetical protein
LSEYVAERAVAQEDAIELSKEIYGPLGGRFNEAKLCWRMPNGGRVGFKRHPDLSGILRWRMARSTARSAPVSAMAWA